MLSSHPHMPAFVTYLPPLPLLHCTARCSVRAIPLRLTAPHHAVYVRMNDVHNDCKPGGVTWLKHEADRGVVTACTLLQARHCDLGQRIRASCFWKGMNAAVNDHDASALVAAFSP